ncbi:LysR family transcriptional regulator [Albidovulum sp.]|uniref:LysR family transcriptional regulator n=1 Tax=Albidovulum sp. TaxID=1872424 RepID=UPI001D3007B1|nr:LysR family transcriptional regulator [Paracoccaceae bacterium]MCC0045310.1 LysR family transcriptional regulator [Defluviimonas sp.]HPE24819.1 LysR family transcriptional regulator [Albidovulum sp.]MCB2121598.1 LysR family transcriptional regulator [Paracoccaceae bacterium]MCB2141671.1 LysR family transcriptional regulator [Paracoccaceae bacterium]
MQIELIETFLDLCETRSFNRTAERLGVTQSTISGRVKALEGALGQRLFIRSRAGTALTLQGMRFEPHARSLRLGWAEARHAISQSGGRAATVRIGIQHDLVGSHFSDLIGAFRAAFPDTSFFFEADYSAQMCADLTTGVEDLAIVFSPRFHPDLYFEPVGEIIYDMVSTEVERLEEVRRETYILPHFSDAMPHAHAALHPTLATAPLSIGQNAAMVSLMRTMGGTAYVLRDTAATLISDGVCRQVIDAQPIPQAVFLAVNQRQRHRPLQRRLFQILREHFRAPTPKGG